MGIPRAWSFVFFGLLLPVSLAAQPETNSAGPVEIGVGQRVRIVAPSVLRERVVGSILGLDAASITVVDTTRGGVKIVPRAAVQTVELSQGRKGAPKRALIGAAVGLATALGLAALAFGDDFSPTPEAIVKSPGIYAFAGLGALVGGISTRERWVAVPLAQAPLATQRRSGRIGVVVSFTF
jgi:hypothetical protein